MNNNDRYFLSMAIRQARLAVRNGNYPYGAIIAKDNTIVSSGYNLVALTFDPTAHAEIIAIRNASQALSSSALNGYTLYTTCEPCLMCLAGTNWAGLKRIVFGIEDPEFGGLVSRKLNQDLCKLVTFENAKSKACQSLFSLARRMVDSQLTWI